MKLQMQNDSLRVRIDEAELDALQAGQTLTLTLGQVSTPLFTLQVALGDVMSFQSTEGWQLSMPRAAVADYVRTLPNRHALELIAQVDGRMLAVQFEVDVRDSLQVRGVRRRVRNESTHT